MNADIEITTIDSTGRRCYVPAFLAPRHITYVLTCLLTEGGLSYHTVKKLTVNKQTHGYYSNHGQTLWTNFRTLCDERHETVDWVSVEYIDKCAGWGRSEGFPWDDLR